MMSTHRERNTENGLFIKQRVKEKQPVCVICCGKSYSVNKECSEFLFYQEAICNLCAINTEIFMHLCSYFRHVETWFS